MYVYAIFFAFLTYSQFRWHTHASRVERRGQFRFKCRWHRRLRYKHTVPKTCAYASLIFLQRDPHYRIKVIHAAKRAPSAASLNPSKRRARAWTLPYNRFHFKCRWRRCLRYKQTVLNHPVCCSVLQRVAACCSVLQCVALRCRALQCVAVCCSVLQCVAVCCSALQRVAARCSALQCVVLLAARATSTASVNPQKRPARAQILPYNRHTQRAPLL